MKTVLIIEDDTALRENTAELLELENYNVYTAPNGKIGVDLAGIHKPDIIVCDIMMPELDGYGVLERISGNPATSHIPFIFLTAKTEHKEIRKGMDLGADDYITKPFEEDELLSAIESRLAKAHLLLGKTDKLDKLKKNEDSLKDLNDLKNYFDDHGKLLKCKKGTFVYEQGEHSNNIYLILKGVVKSYKMDLNGKELITNLHKADEFLGFSSLDLVSPYQENATAVEDTELAAVSKSDLVEVLKNNRNVSLDLMNVLAENLSEVKGQLLQMAYGSVRKKTAHTILQFAEVMSKKPEEAIKISRHDLASVAGIATESLIRTLSGFKKDGIIEIEGRNIKILDISALETME